MFQRNSVLQPIFAHADAVPKSGHRWVQLSGLLKRRTADRLFALRWGIGSKLANRITGYIGAKLDGSKNGHRSKSPRAAVAKRNADAPTMMHLIDNSVGSYEGAGVG